MMKRLLSLLLCLFMLIPCLYGCSSGSSEATGTEEEDKGAVLQLYLSEIIYDLDPARAYNNEAALPIISLLYEPLFTLTEKGKLTSNLVKKYEIVENEDAKEYKLYLTLDDNAYWSDSTYVSAEDVIYAFKRILDVEASFDAACLLYDIKNARKVREGEESIDNLGLSAPDDKLVEITFETYYKTTDGRVVTQSDELNEGETLTGEIVKVDYDQFLLNLTSYALVPLREDIVTKASYYEVTVGSVKNRINKYNDWAKKASTMACSGPFKLRTAEYPDAPLRDDRTNEYILDENGNYLYPVYGVSVLDGSIVALEIGDSYYLNEDGDMVVATAADLTEIAKTDPEKAAEIRKKLQTADLSVFSTEIQNSPQLILERNTYYYKNMDSDNWKLDQNVKPYRLVVDYTCSAEEIMQKYENGEIYYVGNLPLSLREQYVSSANVTDALSTHTFYLNENALIQYSFVEFDSNGLPVLYDKSGKQYVFQSDSKSSDYGLPVYAESNGTEIVYDEDKSEDGIITYYTKDGKKVLSDKTGKPITGAAILSDTNVRLALSEAIDREAIAKDVVLAEAACALVPTGVYNGTSKKTTFRDVGGNSYISSTANLTSAAEKLSAAGITPSDYVLHLSYADYDEVHKLIAKAVGAAWESLGFVVEYNALMPIDNEDFWSTTQELLADVMDDLWLETIESGDYEIISMDLAAKSVDAFGVLAPFAKAFSGMGMDMRRFDDQGQPIYLLTPHITGFDDETYNNLIELAFEEKNADARAERLHEAEEYLMSQMPVIPVIYNQRATFVNTKLLTDTTGNYYAPAGFARCYLKGSPQYQKHVATIRNTVIIVSAVVIVLAAAITVTVILRKKAKKREEEIARISAEHEAKLREIRPGQSKK